MGSVSGKGWFYSGLTHWLRFWVLNGSLSASENGSTKCTVRVCLWGIMRKGSSCFSSSYEGRLTRTCFFLPQIPRGLCSVLCPASLSSDTPSMLSSCSLSEGSRAFKGLTFQESVPTGCCRYYPLLLPNQPKELQNS